LRLLWRHWPALLTIGLVAVGVHRLLGQAALKVVDLDHTQGALGLLIVVLQPLSLLAALVLMLRIVRPSLPWVAAQSPPRAARFRDRLIAVRANLDSVLVPFLVVYSIYGWLRDDIIAYERAALLKNIGEIFANIGNPDAPGPAFLFLGTKIVIVVAAVTFAFRWLTLFLRRRGRLPWLSLISGYLEVLWLMIAVFFVGQVVRTGRDWVLDRQVFAWLGDWWHRLLGQLGPVAAPSRTASDWIGRQLDNADVLLVAPAALLAVGAVVYGRALLSAVSPIDQLRDSRRIGGRPRWLLGSVPQRYFQLWQSLRIMARGGFP
jgi:hypothetical protein